MTLDELKKRVENEDGDYYNDLVLYINALIENNQKDEAFSLIKEELAQPYVPASTLKTLEEIFEQHYVAEVINKQLGVEEAKNALVKLEIGDIVANFYTLNLRLISEEIIYYLEHSNDYISSSILIYSLIDQGVSLNFNITKFSKTDLFNTLDLDIVDGDLLEKYYQLFEKEFEKEPSFVNYCMEILNYYLLVTFPFKYDYDFELYDEIVKYIKKLSLNKHEIEVHPDFIEIIEYDK